MLISRSRDCAPLLEVHDLSVAYHKKPVLYGVDLEVDPGQLVGILGPNGAGKSTFLKAIMGLVPLLGGWVKIMGQPVRKQLNQIAYVPQRESVDWDFPVSALDVVLMGCYGRLGLLKRPDSQERDFAATCLDRVGLLPQAQRQISELSGGQQQRVFVARALAQKGSVYFMDEPFSGIDVATEEILMDLFRDLKEQGKTLFIVHHDLASAPHYFDSLILLNVRLVAFGPVTEVFSPDYLHKTYGAQLKILSEVAHLMHQSP